MVVMVLPRLIWPLEQGNLLILGMNMLPVRIPICNLWNQRIVACCLNRSVIFTNTPMYLWMGRAMYSDVGKCPAEDTCMMSRPDENVRLVRRRRDDVSSLQSTYLRQDQGSKKGSKVETEKQHLC